MFVVYMWFICVALTISILKWKLRINSIHSCLLNFFLTIYHICCFLWPIKLHVQIKIILIHVTSYLYKLSIVIYGKKKYFNIRKIICVYSHNNFIFSLWKFCILICYGHYENTLYNIDNFKYLQRRENFA